MSENGEDEALWGHVTRDMQPINHEKSLFEDDKGIKKPLKVKKIEKTHDFEYVLPQKCEQVFVQSTDIDRRTAERLRKGQFSINGRIDLHGMRKIEAQQALHEFIRRAYASGKRCVLVITGKGAGADGRRDPLNSGHGVIKQSVPQWLCEGDLGSIVLKHVQAQTKDGGSGALYVLLRRRR